jgi:hypothetical protein
MDKRFLRWMGLGLMMAISFVLLSGSSEVIENGKYITTTHTDNCGNTVTDTYYVPDDTPTPAPTPTPTTTTGTGSCSPGTTLIQNGQVATGVTQLTNDQVYPPPPGCTGSYPSCTSSAPYWCPFSTGYCVPSCNSSSCPSNPNPPSSSCVCQ